MADLNPNSLGTPAPTFLERASTCAWGRYLSRTEERIIRMAASREPGQLLDFGCGEGRWTTMLMGVGWQSICADIDAIYLRKCAALNPRATCIQIKKGEGRLPAEDQSIDLIICIEVPGVLESKWFPKEAERVLRSNGAIVGVFHNRDSPRGWFRFLVDSWRGNLCFYRTGFRRWKRQLRQASLAVEHAEGMCWFPFSRMSNSKFIPFCTRMERILGLHTIVEISPWVIFLARKQNDSKG